MKAALFPTPRLRNGLVAVILLGSLDGLIGDILHTVPRDPVYYFTVTGPIHVTPALLAA